MTERIVVSGAGIGGLCAALALIQRGFDVIVCEQASELREVGAGVQLSPNGTRVLASLGVLDDLRAVAVEAEAKEIRLWNSGEKWPLFDLGAAAMAEYGFPYLMVHRGDLQTVLAKAVERVAPSTIRLGAEVVDVRDDGDVATAILANDTEIVGRLVVGADGIHSKLRARTLGAGKAAFTGCIAWRGVVPSERLPAHLRRAVGANWVGPGRHVVTYPLRRGELVNFVGVVERQGWETERLRGGFPGLASGRARADRQYRCALSLGADEPAADRALVKRKCRPAGRRLPSDAAIHGAGSCHGDRRRDSSGAMYRGAPQRSRGGYPGL
jgi:salicylate hydroxylase